MTLDFVRHHLEDEKGDLLLGNFITTRAKLFKFAQLIDKNWEQRIPFPRYNQGTRDYSLIEDRPSISPFDPLNCYECTVHRGRYFTGRVLPKLRQS